MKNSWDLCLYCFQKSLQKYCICGKCNKHSNPESVYEHRRSLLEQSKRGSSGNTIGKQSHPGIHLLTFSVFIIQTFPLTQPAALPLTFYPLLHSFLKGLYQRKTDFSCFLKFKIHLCKCLICKFQGPGKRGVTEGNRFSKLLGYGKGGVQYQLGFHPTNLMHILKMQRWHIFVGQKGLAFPS